MPGDEEQTTPQSRGEPVSGADHQPERPGGTPPSSADPTAPTLYKPAAPNPELTLRKPIGEDAIGHHSPDDETPDEWKLGVKFLDSYTVKSKLGQGGFGAVYRVRHEGWNMDLAIKTPRPNMFRTEQQKKDFEAECETWINLGLHPNTVGCYYIRRRDGIPLVFAECVEGGTLQGWINNRRLYEGGADSARERILDIAIQFAWGLRYAHEQGLIHQDVKPDNVLMTEDGIAKVTDFGLARARSAAGDQLTEAPAGQSILVPGAGVMTPPFASPEQENGLPLSRNTDVWSWAVSVLEMFTGEVHWKNGCLALHVLEALLKMGPKHSEVPKIPNPLVPLLRRCFEPNLADRPKDLAELLTNSPGQTQSLLAIYREVTGETFAREEPEAAELLADGLNNKALSKFDLGKPEEAEKLWEEALKVEPHHPEATYNRGLVRWRSARITDDALVRELEEMRSSHPGRWIDEYLLGLVHIERGDAEAAVKLLEEAAASQGAGHVQADLARARSGIGQWPGWVRAFEGHTEQVNSVCFSLDGRWALSGSTDNTLRLWDASTGRCIRTFQGHTKMVSSVCFSPDGRWALSGSTDNTLRLWDTSTGRCLRTFQGHTEQVNSVCFSPDGRWALSGSTDNTLRLWEVSTGRTIRAFEGHTSDVTSVSFSPDGCWALSGGYDRTLRLWEVSTGRCLGAFEEHTSTLNSVCFSPDGCRALSGDNDNTLRLWEVSTRRCIRAFEGHRQWVKSVCFSPDGRWALSGSNDNTLRLWEVSTGRCVRTFEGHTFTINSVCFSPDGRWALSGSIDSTLRLWRITHPGRQEPFAVTRPGDVTAALAAEREVDSHVKKAQELLRVQRYAAALEHLRVIRADSRHARTPRILEAWHTVGVHARRTGVLGGWTVKLFQGHTNGVDSVCFSPDGRWALSGSPDNTLRLWEVPTGRCVRALEGQTNQGHSVCFSPDGRWALFGSEHNTLRLWEVSTGQCDRTFEGHNGIVYTVCFSPDGRWALSGSGDKTLRLWEVSTGRCVRTFEGHRGDVYSVCFSPDGRWVLSGAWDDTRRWDVSTNRWALSGSNDKTLRLWEVSTGQCVRTFVGHKGIVYSVCFSPDGRWALSGSMDGTLRLWEVSTGRYVRTFEGHKGYVYSVCFNPDGHWALSGSEDRTLRLWEISTGRCLRTFEGHTHSVKSICFSPDACWALSGSSDMTLWLWKFDWDLEVPDPSDWDEGALPYLSDFLTLHTPNVSVLPTNRVPTEHEIVAALSRSGTPTWTEEDFQGLLRKLGHVGFGWLRPEGVRKKLDEMAANWIGPPALLGQSVTALPQSTATGCRGVDDGQASEARSARATYHQSSRKAVKLEANAVLADARRILEQGKHEAAKRVVAEGLRKLVLCGRPLLDRHAIEVWEAQLDVVRRIIWVTGDIGTTLAAVVAYPYDFDGRHLSPCEVVDVPSDAWWSYKDGRSPVGLVLRVDRDKQRPGFARLIAAAGNDTLVYEQTDGQGCVWARYVIDYNGKRVSGPSPVSTESSGSAPPKSEAAARDTGSGGTPPMEVETLIKEPDKGQARPEIPQLRVKPTAQADQEQGHTRERACPYCGKAVPRQARFCVHCGKRVLRAHGVAVGRMTSAWQGRVCACGARNLPGNAFCNQCGQPLPVKGHAKCGHCGRSVPAGVKFCVHCGEGITGNSSP